MENLSQEDYLNILQLRFNTQSIKVLDAEYTSLTGNLDGFMGEHNILKLTYTLDNVTGSTKFFVKSKPTKENSKRMAEELLVCEKEILLYDTLIREFTRRGYNVSFAPRIFLCKDNNMVMNDLKSEGYYSSGRLNFFDLTTIKSAVKSLALFHGSSFIYEEEKSKELGRIFRLDNEYPVLTEKYFQFDNPDNIGYKYFQNSVEAFVKITDLFDESQNWKEDFKHQLKNINFFEIFTKDLNFRKALGHGDIWSNNMLFKQEEELKCCIFDYQALRYYNVAFDVLCIIYLNTRREIRNQHFDYLVNYYYEILNNILLERNLKLESILSKEDYMKSINYYKLFAKFTSSSAHTLTFLDFTKLKSFLDNKSLEELIGNSRPILVYEAFKCDKLFKEIMVENLYEIKDLL